MIWKGLLLGCIVTLVGARRPGHDDPSKGSLYLISKLLGNNVADYRGSSRMDEDNAFPDLDLTSVNTGGLPFDGYSETSGGVPVPEKQTKTTQKTGDINRYQPVPSYDQGGNGDVRDDIFKIMNIIFAIMKFQGLITSTKPPVPSLIHNGFELLADYLKRKSIESKYDETECPYSFDSHDGVCLSFDVDALGLTWYEARIYCQVIKGGDLAVFRDANEYNTMIKYVKKFDIGSKRHDFWIGASSEGYNNQFTFINGDRVPDGSPYWGSRIPGGKQNPSGRSGSDFAILNHTDNYYLSDTSYEESILPESNTVPLCRFYHGKERYSHYGYHSDYFYHESSNDIAIKFKNIISVGTKNTQGSNGPFGNQAPDRRIN